VTLRERCAYTAPAPKINHADAAAYLANDFVPPEDEHDVSAPRASREDEEEETSRGAASAFAW
jgi:hypothetical protein